MAINMLRRKSKKSKTVPVHVAFDAVCKICLDNSSSSEMIHPCKCTGSVRYVHEECLKSWVLAKYSDIENAKCELCYNSYNMVYKVGTGCASRQQAFSNMPKFLIGPLLLIIEAMIAFMIYLLLEMDSSSRTEILKLILIAICGAAGVAIAFLIAIVFKQIFLVRKLKKWIFYNSEDKDERVESTTILPNQINFSENSKDLVIPIRTNVGGVSVLVEDVIPERFMRRQRSFLNLASDSVNCEVLPNTQTIRHSSSDANLVVKKNNFLEDSY